MGGDGTFRHSSQNGMGVDDILRRIVRDVRTGAQRADPQAPSDISSNSWFNNYVTGRDDISRVNQQYGASGDKITLVSPLPHLVNKWMVSLPRKRAVRPESLTQAGMVSHRASKRWNIA